MKDPHAGLYIHVPFCLRKCPYCDFYSQTDLSLTDSYLTALNREMELYEDPDREFDTIYIGGGTPSVLSPARIGEIISGIYERFQIRDPVEISIEVNPGTVDARGFSGYRNAGVNRLNIGVQSFMDANLSFLGRIHGAKEGKNAITLARKAGFSNLGIDMIYGLPGQTLANWRADLKQAIDFSPEHLSCYMLTCEPGTPLDTRRKEGMFRLPSESSAARLFLFTIDFLKSHGYAQYEISNFARGKGQDLQRYQSRHNRKYWNFVPYLGLGPSAHSFTGMARFWNCRSTSRYIELLGEGKAPVEGRETLTQDQRIMEAVMLGLRKTEGIDPKAFVRDFGLSISEKTRSRLKKEGYLTPDDSRWALTPLGMTLLDSIRDLIIDELLS